MTRLHSSSASVIIISTIKLFKLFISFQIKYSTWNKHVSLNSSELFNGNFNLEKLWRYNTFGYYLSKLRIRLMLWSFSNRLPVSFNPTQLSCIPLECRERTKLENKWSSCFHLVNELRRFVIKNAFFLKGVTVKSLTSVHIIQWRDN